MKLTNYLLILGSFFIMSAVYLNAQTLNGQFEVVTNNSSIYEVKLQLNTDTGIDDLGSGNLVINYNDTDLRFPLIEINGPTVNVDYFWSSEILNNGNYSSSANKVSKPFLNQFWVNLELTSDNNGLILAASPNWTDIITIRFTINNSGGNSGLDWQNGVPGSGFNVFNGDNETSFTLGTFTDLNTSPLPVELTNFTASNSNADVKLNWETATEVDNYGFELERSLDAAEKNWRTLSFTPGYGNSNSPKEYSYVDHSPIGGNKFIYRLKQIDNDGTYTYSDLVEVEVIPNQYELYQNYPNPFNPSTTIRFSLRETQNVKIVIFDQLGQEVQTIVNQQYEAGYHEFEFNAASFASGVYFYRIIAGDFVNVKKMMLLK